MYYTYLLTDPNRMFIQAGISNDLFNTMTEATIMKGNTTTQSTLNRMVYFESFLNKDEAERRFIELSSFGRIVKERLIRKTNPNWSSLHQQFYTAQHIKKAVVYA
ncbi:GIY-YIG nuclease family protein [Sphingobacterium sp. HJSM2_6]|uniref:GIY-YIG nuclease family protein n=1 Tax=Sphingobacterium sp. HJSM2_6 TaxID=3366264 RepID=UPI003BC656DD